MSRAISKLAAITSAIIGVSVLYAAAPAFGALQNEVPESRPIRDWVAVQSLPAAFQGRWGQMRLAGTNERAVRPGACTREGVESADLVLGPNWFMSSTNHGFLTELEYSASEQTVRLKAVDNAEGELAVTRELFTLEDSGRTLEIASNPEIGWEVSTYQKCE